MAEPRSPLVDAHIEGQARLRKLLGRVITQTWGDLPGHDRANVDEWLSRVLPAVEASQRASVALTNAYLARSLERQPVGVPQEELIGAAVRNGTPPATVYERPFVTLWGGLGSGLDWAEASKKALGRATSTGAIDVQLSMRAAAEAVDRVDQNMFGYRRVADAGACQFCKEVDGAYVKGSSGFVYALHNHCGCGLEPLTEPHKGAVELPDGTEVRPYAYGPLNENVAVELHGELGPVLTKPGDHFTTESQI
jgi:hypothetical protein